MQAVFVFVCCVSLFGSVSAENDGPLTLVKLADPMAKCLDGSPGAMYVRAPAPGVKKFVIFFEGGGWCGSPSNCLSRASTPLGSSTSYPPSIPNTGYEGGSGFLSGNSSITAFADFGVAYLKYCSGGSFTGRTLAPQKVGNASLWYRGHYILDAAITELTANHNLGSMAEIVVSGCSAGGMACYIHCDSLAAKLSFAKVKCICDAGVFQDVVALNGQRITRNLYTWIYQAMNATLSVPPACAAQFPANPALCMFPQYILPTLKTPTFMVNSMYNFFGYEMGTSFQPSWKACVPANGGITPETYAKCNSTQKAVLQAFHETFINNAHPMWDPSSPHGSILTACPNQHCETSTGWNLVKVGGTLMRDAVGQWYAGKPTKLVDQPFPSNPTCGY